MTRSKSTSAIPAQWSKYIKAHAGKYATGIFSREDAEQVASMAFLNARARFKPGKGVFERYAKTSIRNALLNARRAERKHWDQREDPDEDYEGDISTPLWAGEDLVLDSIDDATRAQRILDWADTLAPPFVKLWQGLYARDLSQREFAVEAGVSQARVSQRNKQFLARARTDLEQVVS